MPRFIHIGEFKAKSVNTLSYKTKYAYPAASEREWFVVDANDQVLGRFASKVASLIRGKHKTNYTPNTLCGDNVIVINADKIRMTGKKWQNKEYVTYSGYPGGQKRLTPKQIHVRSNTRLVEMAIKGMLPKSRLGRKMFGNLYVYAGTEHPHGASNPKNLEIK
ncbi:MAG TPA: 50S ribosomal protein L13 [Cyclobacteriaceae bacterium]|nr:50S ribosomal protein L13 [Cyclobacteriaceae bacterium]